MNLEEFHEMVLFLATADTLHVEYLTEVGVVLIGDVD